MDIQALIQQLLRGVSLVIIYEAYEREGWEMQPPVLETFW
jgi:hypothetical protein